MPHYPSPYRSAKNKTNTVCFIIVSGGSFNGQESETFNGSDVAQKSLNWKRIERR